VRNKKIYVNPRTDKVSEKPAEDSVAIPKYYGIDYIRRML
jgi:hypothetical protein